MSGSDSDDNVCARKVPIVKRKETVTCGRRKGRGKQTRSPTSTTVYNLRSSTRGSQDKTPRNLKRRYQYGKENSDSDSQDSEFRGFAPVRGENPEVSKLAAENDDVVPIDIKIETIDIDTYSTASVQAEHSISYSPEYGDDVVPIDIKTEPIDTYSTASVQAEHSISYSPDYDPVDISRMKTEPIERNPTQANLPSCSYSYDQVDISRMKTEPIERNPTQANLPSCSYSYDQVDNSRMKTKPIERNPTQANLPSCSYSYGENRIKTEPLIEPKLEPKLEPKIEPKLEPKIEPKIEPKTEPDQRTANPTVPAQSPPTQTESDGLRESRKIYNDIMAAINKLDEYLQREDDDDVEGQRKIINHSLDLGLKHNSSCVQLVSVLYKKTCALLRRATAKPVVIPNRRQQ